MSTAAVDAKKSMTRVKGSRALWVTTVVARLVGMLVAPPTIFLLYGSPTSYERPVFSVMATLSIATVVGGTWLATARPGRGLVATGVGTIVKVALYVPVALFAVTGLWMLAWSSAFG